MHFIVSSEELTGFHARQLDVDNFEGQVKYCSVAMVVEVEARFAADGLQVEKCRLIEMTDGCI